MDIPTETEFLQLKSDMSDYFYCRRNNLPIDPDEFLRLQKNGEYIIFEPS